MYSKLGTEIKVLRKKLGLSQKQLAHGICDQSEISRIEKGRVYPRMDVLSQLALRLRVNIQHFLSLSNDRTDYMNETISYVKTLNRLHKYGEMFELTRSELKKEGLIDSHYYYCFLTWKNTIAQYKLSQLNCEDSVNVLRSIINTNQLILRHDLLDLRILHSMATIYAESGHYEESIVYYKQILHMNIETEQFPIFITKVIHNYAKCLYKLGRYSDSIITIKKGLKICKEYHGMEMIGYMYLRLAKSQEKLSHRYSKKEIARNYYYALFFLNALDMKQYGKVIKEEKRHYLDLLNVEDVLEVHS